MAKSNILSRKYKSYKQTSFHKQHSSDTWLVVYEYGDSRISFHRQHPIDPCHIAYEYDNMVTELCYHHRQLRDLVRQSRSTADTRQGVPVTHHECR